MVLSAVWIVGKVSRKYICYFQNGRSGSSDISVSALNSLRNRKLIFLSKKIYIYVYIYIYIKTKTVLTGERDIIKNIFF